MKILKATLFALLILYLPSSRSYAQAPGFAEILEPHGGEAIQSVYTIRGSASHPSFTAYQLSFAYAQDPTGTWFQLGERQENPIIDDGLALWDTSGLSDGEYRLRLEVFLENETSIVAIVEGVRIRNQSAIETPTPGLVTARVTATQIPPTKTPRPTPLPPAAFPGSSNTQRALIAGTMIGFLLLSSLGVYIFIRQRARQRWGMLQMRQILRTKTSKRKSRDKS